MVGLEVEVVTFQLDQSSLASEGNTSLAWGGESGVLPSC